MRLIDSLTRSDAELVKKLDDFIPASVFDIHAHLFERSHFIENTIHPLLKETAVLGLAQYLASVDRWLPRRSVEGLFFGFPHRGDHRSAINRWMAGQMTRKITNNRGLALVSPEDKPNEVDAQIRELGLVGIKPYHVYAAKGDTAQVGIEDFAPEWMWDICQGIDGVLMLHIMKDLAIADRDNQADIHRLCRKYPKCRLILAHVARSFNYRLAREGLGSLIDLDNVWVDTSAITETESIRKALQTLGSQRVLFGSDYPVSEIRGRCVAINNSFLWIYPGETVAVDAIYPKTEGTLIGLESLACLREACEDTGLNECDIHNIFRNNALRLLAPHLNESVEFEMLSERQPTPALARSA